MARGDEVGEAEIGLSGLDFFFLLAQEIEGFEALRAVRTGIDFDIVPDRIGRP